MSTITKERLQRLIRAIDSGSYDEEEIVGWVNSDEIMELARIALASLEAEVVITVGDDGGDALAYRSLIQTFAPGTKLFIAQPAPAADEDKVLAEQARAVIHCLDMCSVPSGDYAENEQLQLWGRVIEYGRHPAPVSVPDELTKSLTSIAKEYQTTPQNALFIVVGWNACRAAMLQGANGNSPTITDGWVACSERMPEIEGHYLVWAKASNLDGYCDHLAMATTKNDMHPSKQPYIYRVISKTIK